MNKVFSTTIYEKLHVRSSSTQQSKEQERAEYMKQEKNAL